MTLLLHRLNAEKQSSNVSTETPSTFWMDSKEYEWTSFLKTRTIPLSFKLTVRKLLPSHYSRVTSPQSESSYRVQKKDTWGWTGNEGFLKAIHPTTLRPHTVCHSNANTVQGLDINPNNLWAQTTTAWKTERLKGAVSHLDPIYMWSVICNSVLWSWVVHKEEEGEGAFLGRGGEMNRRLSLFIIQFP